MKMTEASKLYRGQNIITQKVKLSNSFSRWAASYDLWALPQNEVADVLVSTCDPETLTGRLLDVGCGTGLLSRRLLDILTEPDITGLDISPKALCLYEQVNPQCVLGDTESLPFADATFSHSLSSFTLHWTNIAKSLPEMSRVTDKYLSIALPIKGSLEAFSFRYPDKDYIMGILESNGLDILSCDIKKQIIPFKGLDFVRYFHFTGTDFHTNKNTGLKGKKTMESWKTMYQKEEYFLVLYVTGQKR